MPMTSLPRLTFLENRPFVNLFTSTADFGFNSANAHFVPRCLNSCTVRRKSVSRPFHLGHSTNTVAANYGSGYALEVMREHMEKVW